MDAVIEIESAAVVKSGRMVLGDASLRVNQGEFVGISGANGAGKTTLLHLVNGLVSCVRGSVRVFGRVLDRSHVRAIRTRIGYLPQYFETDGRTPVLAGEVVLMGWYGKAGLLHSPGKAEVSRAHAAMDAAGTGHLFGRPFGQLSGGERQRVMLARALMPEPEVLLLDEPFASLSEEAAVFTAGWLERIHRESGLTTLMVSHETEILDRLCDRIVTVDGGRVIGGPTQ